MDDLDKLRQPVSTEQVRQIIYAAVKDDKRYADFKRDFSRNQEMDINVMKAHLLEAARENDDLVGDPKLSKKALKAARAAELGPQTAAAQGAVQQKADRDKSNKEMCTQFLYGSCKLGDACTRRHVELATLNEEAAKRGKQRQEETDKGGDKAEDKSSEDKSAKSNSRGDERSKVCNQFRANGTCEYGDNCIFDHPTSGQKAKACRTKRQHAPIDLPSLS